MQGVRSVLQVFGNENLYKPDYFVQTFTKQMPGVWKVLDGYIKERYSDRKSLYSKWCFLPVHAYADMFDRLAPGYKWNVWAHRDRLSVTLSAIHPWRYTRQIYVMDELLFEELIQTPYEETIPMDVLQRFPNYAIFVQTEKMSFFISMPDGVDKTNNNLAFLGLTPGEDGKLMWSEMLLPIENGKTIRQKLDELDKLYKNANISEDNPYAYTLENSNVLMPYMLRMVNVVLYLCSTQPDIVDKAPTIKLHPFHVHRKSNGKFKILPAIKTKTFFVGENVGKIIKEHNESLTISRGKVRPHVRRAHWHGYWKGPKAKEREFILKWLPPTLVATTNGYQDSLLIGVQNG